MRVLACWTIGVLAVISITLIFLSTLRFGVCGLIASICVVIAMWIAVFGSLEGRNDD